jgi:hypothetical protein
MTTTLAHPAEAPAGPEPYWLYLDPAVRMPSLHRASCVACDGGIGVRRRPAPETRWSGPYATLEEAFAAARAWRGHDPRPCLRCTP